MQQRNVRMHGPRKRWWGDPVYRVSHVSVAWQPRVVHVTNGHAVNTGFISYHITCIRSTDGRVNGYTFRSVPFSKRIGFDSSGSSGSRSFREVLDDSNVFEVTVVVHTTSGCLSVRSCRSSCTRYRGTCRITGRIRTCLEGNLAYPCTWRSGAVLGGSNTRVGGGTWRRIGK